MAASIALMVVGIIIFFVNRKPGIHIGFRGVPWLDVPTVFLLVGGLFLVLRIEMRRRAKDRAERRSRGEW